MSEEWNIKIVDVGYKLEKDIYIFRRNFNNEVVMLSGEILNKGVTPTQPTLSLTNEQLRKLAEAINNEGINPQKEFVEGKLEATENHLKDMRTLLKLK